MKTLSQIREEYPYYKKFDDKQLADAIYNKHYSHASRDEFNKRINYQEEPDQGFLEKLPRNVMTGMAEMGRGLVNSPHNIANLFGQGNKIPELVDSNFDYSQALGLNNNPTLSDKILRAVPQVGMALTLPEANIGKLGKAIGSIPKVGKFLQGATEAAIPQAIFGATQNKNPIAGAVESGAGSVVGSGLGAGIEKAINAVRPSKFLRGNLTDKQLKENIATTKGTETGLGQVLESPILNRIQENILPNILGSGAEKIAQKNANNIQDIGTKLVNKMRGKIQPNEFSSKLQDALKSASTEARAAKNANFENLNKLADENNLKIGRGNFQEAASKHIKDIEESPELKNEFGNDLYSDLIRYSENKKGNNLKLTNIFRGKLGDKANEFYRDGKMHEYGIVKDLQNSLTNDIDSAFEKSGNPEVKETYQATQKDYKENFAPFEDPDIVKFTRQGGDSDLILSHFLKSGANDRANLLAKLDRAYKQNKGLKSQEANLLPSAYLSKAFDEEGKINPLKLRTLYNKLGPNQKKILFGEGKLHNDIKKYSDLVGKNLDSFNLMANPKTGARLSSLAQAAIGAAHIPSALTVGALANRATKLLTSPKYREKLVNTMIKNKDFTIPKTKKVLQKGLAATAGVIGNNKEQKPLELYLNHGQRR